MPTFGGYTLLLSLTVLLIAGIIGIAKRTQIPLLSESVYCYDSIQTFSDKHTDVDCFSFSPTGIFTRIYKSEDDVIDINAVRSDGVVIPGLWDGHGHVLGLGEVLSQVQLYNLDLKASIGRLNEWAKAYPELGSRSDWILGSGWNQMEYGRMPLASDFEEQPDLKGKYIMLYRVDAHCIWVSESVLGLLPDPIPTVPGGEIIGRGVLCDSAMDLVLDHAPKPSEAKMSSQIKSALKALNEVGLVGVHEAGVTPSRMRLYQELADSEDWTVRIYAMYECEIRNTFCPDDAFKVEREDGRLVARSVKLFSDGALGSWGSSMIEPYDDRPQSTGSLMINASTMKELTHSWSNAGFQVNIHAIGDQANQYVIDAFESTYETLCPDLSPLDCQIIHRFRIEHAQIIHPADQKRMFTLGIIPSIQPTHATSDMTYAELRLGHSRTTSEAYRMRSLLPLNPILGSDFPVEPINPLHGIYAAVTRRSPRTGKGKDGADEGWYMDEALSLQEAVRGFTRGPAYGAFLDGKAGIIEEGAWADWVVLDAPLEEARIEELLTMRVRETWVGGKRVYRRED